MMNPAEFAHGPFLIGSAFNLLLYGIMIAQMYFYFHTYSKRDHFWMKCFVVFLLLTDTVNTVFDFLYIYQALVLHFGDTTWLATSNWVFSSEPVTTGIIGGSVQLFFAWRIHVLTKSPLVVLAIVLLSIAGILGSVGVTIGVEILRQFIEFQKLEATVIVWLVSAVCADAIITTALVMHLRNVKNGFPVTDDAIDRIIRLTMQTGLLTAVWAAVDLVVYLTDPTGLHLLFNVPLAKLYTNSLLSSLNARGGWKYDMSSQVTSRGENSTRPVAMQHQSAHPGVFIHIEEHEMVEDFFHRHKRHSEGASRKGSLLEV